MSAKADYLDIKGEIEGLSAAALAGKTLQRGLAGGDWVARAAR
jgi:hypothetical protein